MTRIYRLAVTYPAGSGTPASGTADGWRPEGWAPGDSFTYTPYNDADLGECEFRWPSERLFLSRSGAVRRAGLLRACGCVVEVQPSEPVTWTGPDPTGRGGSDVA